MRNLRSLWAVLFVIAALVASFLTGIKGNAIAQSAFNYKVPIALDFKQQSAMPKSPDNTLTRFYFTSSGAFILDSSGNSYRQLNAGATALTAASTVAINPTTVHTFTLTPAQAETISSTSVPPAGTPVYLIVTTSGTTSYTLTFGTGFKVTTTLATGTTSAKVFVVTFISNGTVLNEVSRTTAM